MPCLASSSIFGVWVLAVRSYQRRSKKTDQESNDVLVHGGSDINGNANY